MGEETRPGRTQCRKKEGVFNTLEHKATQTEGRDPKMHLKETLGLEKLKKIKKIESSAFKQEKDSAWAARCCASKV